MFGIKFVCFVRTTAVPTDGGGTRGTTKTSILDHPRSNIPSRSTDKCSAANKPGHIHLLHLGVLRLQLGILLRLLGALLFHLV